MKERDMRVGGRLGKTAEEREDVEMKEKEGGETVGWNCLGESEQSAKQINNQLTGITKWLTHSLPEPIWRGSDGS